MVTSPINSNESCVRRFVEPRVAPDSSPAQTSTPGSTQDSSISSLSPIEVQIKQQIEAQKAQWKSERTALESQLKKVGEEFGNLAWYDKLIYGVFYGAQALALQVQIGRLSYLENTDTTALEAQLKTEIEKFRADFDKSVVGNPDQKVPNPFAADDPNAPKLNNVFPMVGAKGTSVVGGGGVSLGKTLFNGALFFFGEWLPLQFQISLYNIMK